MIFFPLSFWLAFSIQYSLYSYTHVQLLQYLSEECGPCSLSEFKAFLENRGRIRTQLIEDLKKKRTPQYFQYHNVANNIEKEGRHICCIQCTQSAIISYHKSA